MKKEMLLEVNPGDVKDLKMEIIPGEKVSEEKVESSLDYNKLTDDEKKMIDEFISEIDVNDTNQIIGYGVQAQKNITSFSDSVLENVKTKSTGSVGNLLADLTSEIKSFDGDIGMELKPSFFNSIKKQVRKMIAKYSKVETNISSIEKELENHKLRMMKDIALFDGMYEKNLEYFKLLSLYIIAGEKKLQELKSSVLPELKSKAETTGEQADAQAYNDMVNKVNRFEKKLYDLKTTRIISIQMAPQIRLIQNNDAELVEKIQSSIVNTIPLWKNQMIIALGITNSQMALQAQEKVTNLTNDMLKKNSELLKQGTVKVAKESERAIVDIETLKKTNKDILETLDAIVKIHEEGSMKRQEAEKELSKIEADLKNKLMNMESEK